MRAKTGANDELYYPLADHLGNVTALSELDGTFVTGSDTRYEPFGTRYLCPIRI